MATIKNEQNSSAADSGMAVYRRISEDLRQRLLDGDLAGRKRLPSVKALATHYHTSTVTVLRGINLLKAEGLLSSRWGGGIYPNDRPGVARLRRMATFILAMANHPQHDEPVVSYWNRNFQQIMLGLQEECAQQEIANQNIFIPHELLDDEAQLAAYLQMHAPGIDGAICIWSGFTHESARRFQTLIGCPILFVDSPYSQLDDLNYLHLDLYANARKVLAHLLAAGHRRIGAIASQEDSQHYYLPRVKALRDALAEAGLPLPDDCFVLCNENISDITRASNLLLQLPAGRRPTAVFCFNDLRALTFLKTARELGIDIPGQIALAGFDGTPQAIAEGITTVQLPYHYLGLRSVQLLRHIVERGLFAPVSEHIGTGLFIGPTTSHPVAIS